MGKFLKWTLITLLGLAIVVIAMFRIQQNNTKKYSPEAEVEYARGGLEMSVFYNRPYKKNRKIYGGLVPYGEVWRTGANEATTFTTNKDLLVAGHPLKAGKYTLWTIPGKENWQVMLNSKQYSWGVTFSGAASREAQYDVLNAQVLPEHIPRVIEQFTISFKETDTLYLSLEWDQTEVKIPIEEA